MKSEMSIHVLLFSKYISFMIACTADRIVEELHRCNSVPQHQNKPMSFKATYSMKNFMAQKDKTMLGSKNYALK
jgi:hypothetical protein